MIIFYEKRPSDQQQDMAITNSTIVLEKMESLGKLELVKYNFKEITEYKELSREKLTILKILGSNRIDPDSEAILISHGEAVGCLDLTKIKKEDITFTADTVLIVLPHPELCYYKIDLENTQLYSLKTGYFVDEKAFVESAYEKAEEKIKEAALQTGILEQTKINAQLILKPLLQETSGNKNIILRFNSPGHSLNTDR